MHASYWGLRRSPFRATLDPRDYVPTPPQEEALARLHYLADDRRSFALLQGARGCGKSLLLATFARQLRRSGRAAAVAPLLAASPDTILVECDAAIAGAAGQSPGASDSATEARWRSIEQGLAQLARLELPLTILADDADAARPDTLTAVARLLELAAALRAPLLVVLSCQPNEARSLPPRLRERCDLRIDLSPWDALTTSEFVAQSLIAAGGREEIFELSALVRLFELTGGVPRRVVQLAELALVAAAGQGRTAIDEYLLDAACEELSPPSRDPLFEC